MVWVEIADKCTLVNLTQARKETLKINMLTYKIEQIILNYAYL
jgi:hypothetical protein